jgi:hypothetical protein
MRRLSAVLIAFACAFTIGLWVGLSGEHVLASIRSAKLATVADSSDPSKVQPSDLNPLVCTSPPQDADICVERTGAKPNRRLTVKISDLGEWVEIATVER